MVHSWLLASWFLSTLPAPVAPKPRSSCHGDWRRVPSLHGGVPPVVPEDADRPRIEEEVAALRDGEIDPPRREGAKNVAVREERHVPARRAEPGKEPIETDTDLRRALSSRAAVL